MKKLLYFIAAIVFSTTVFAEQKPIWPKAWRYMALVMVGYYEYPRGASLIGRKAAPLKNIEVYDYLNPKNLVGILYYSKQGKLIKIIRPPFPRAGLDQYHRHRTWNQISKNQLKQGWKAGHPGFHRLLPYHKNGRHNLAPQRPPAPGKNR